MKTLIVSEIYKSVQGESSYTGLPCTFIRLTGCPLRCRWCDTTYGFRGGKKLSFSEITQEVRDLGASCVEFTGGEPLAQAHSVHLMKSLCEEGFKVLLETSGSQSLQEVPKEVHIIMDLKCPGSQMAHKNDLKNLAYLKSSDEIKFVISGREDYLWAKNMIEQEKLAEHFSVLLSPVWGELDPELLTEWLLEDRLKVRLNLQIHKYIWDPDKKGV